MVAMASAKTGATAPSPAEAKLPPIADLHSFLLNPNSRGKEAVACKIMAKSATYTFQV